MTGMYPLTKNGANSDLAIAAAATVVCEEVSDLDGAAGLTVSAELRGGTGGTSVKAYVQAEFAGVWCDIMCFAFTTAAHKVMNVSGLTPRLTPATPTDGTLADNTVLDGILASKIRTKVVSVGTYAGSTVLAMRAEVRP